MSARREPWPGDGLTLEPPPPGYCPCGCGKPCPPAPRTNRHRGWVRGEPLPAVPGHAIGSKLAPDGYLISTATTKWCPECGRRFYLEAFYLRPDRAKRDGYCMGCLGQLTTAREARSPHALEARRARAKRSYDQVRADPYRWAKLMEKHKLYARQARARRRLSRDAARLELRQEEQRYLKDPPCLQLGDPMASWLIDRVIAHHGDSQTLVEERLGMSIGGLHRFRAERYMQFDLVDRLLTMILEPQRLSDFDFAPRSQRRAEAQAARGGPLPESVRRREKRERRRVAA